VHPRPERRVAAERREPAQRAQERLLGEILGARAVALREAKRQPPDPILVALHERRRCGPVTAARAREQLGFVRRGGSRGRGVGWGTLEPVPRDRWTGSGRDAAQEWRGGARRFAQLFPIGRMRHWPSRTSTR